jgi:hypothetical protein
MPIMNPKPRLDDLPDRVREAFADRTLLSLPATARLLGMHHSTLRGLCDAGKIAWRHKGFRGPGERRYFGVDEVARIWHTMRSGPVVGPENRSLR